MSDLNEHIKKLRDDFSKGSLSEEEIHPNPFFQFETWLSQAVQSQLPEAQAMVLSTVLNGQPSSRILYLREFSNHQFWFYGNYGSGKGKALASAKKASLLFFWSALERQVRIEGTVEKASEEMSDAYFKARPRESQIGAWASSQSEKISARSALEKRVKEFTEKFGDGPVPRPPHWGGWVLTAHYYEFWQGRVSRLHDRIVYEKKGNDWQIYRLNP